MFNILSLRKFRPEQYTMMLQFFLAVTHYSSNHISHKSYIHSPQVSSSIKKKQPSSRDLLKLGTTESSPCKTNTGVIKPKPIELLNQRRKLLIRKSGDKTQTERRKLLTKKSTDKAETFNEIDSVVMNEEYVDALTKAKNKDKLSDNVKEKMSSLLKAIKDEQSLVENDMERKSKEITLKEDRFSLSSGNKRQCENTLRPHRNEVVEGSNKVVDRKVENDKILKPDTLRKTEILDVVHDTKHTTNQSADNNEYIRIKEHQSQSLSMHAEGRFDQKHGRQTYQMSKMIEDKHRSGKTNNDHAHFIRDKSTSRNTSTTSSKSSHSELMSDSVEVEFMNAQNASTATDINYSQRGSKVDKQTFGSHKKHVPRQPTDRQMAHDTDNNVSVMFEQMYSEVITPKRNKYPSSDENEYVDIISPFDRMSASKRQISERKRGLISSSKKKIESPSYKPVRPKAVVKPDSWRQSISTEKNDNHALERQNKAASSETVEFSAECQDNYSDSEDVDSDIEVIPDKRENTDVDTSQYSVGRKSFDKASESIRNLKHNETKMTGYNHYVDKKRVSEHGRHRSGIVTENENPKVDLQSLDRRNIRTDQSSQSSSNRNSSYHDDLETSKRIRQSIGPSKGLNTQDVISRKERLVFARRSAMPDTEEQTLTPIPKAMAQSVPSNVSDSPEIVYRLKEGLNDGNKWKASQAQNQIPQECEKDDSTQRNQKQRKSVGRHVHKSRSSNVANTNLDLVKFRTIRRSTGADDYNLCNSVDTNQSTGHDDPFEFSGTPGSTMKKVNIQGIGERIEQKRSKVKKKARKSLLFEQQDTDEDCCESDNSQSVCSSDTQHDTYGERNDRNSGDRLEKRKVMDQKYHNVIQNSTPVVMNKGQEFHNRKRPLSDDLGVNPADFIMAEKKHKPLIGQTVHKTFDAVVKKPKLSQAFDTTFTIDSNRLKQKHTKGPFK